MSDYRSRIAIMIQFFSAAIAVFVAAIHRVLNDLSEFAHQVANAIDWPEFIPTAAQSIDLDRASRRHTDHRQPAIASQFASFFKRALTHSEFTSDHYDPGWRPA